jgi:hypothetical protein
MTEPGQVRRSVATVSIIALSISAVRTPDADDGPSGPPGRAERTSTHCSSTLTL